LGKKKRERKRDFHKLNFMHAARVFDAGESRDSERIPRPEVDVERSKLISDSSTQSSALRQGKFLMQFVDKFPAYPFRSLPLLTINPRTRCAFVIIGCFSPSPAAHDFPKISSCVEH
jgi:hypothetical protein